MKSVKIPVPFHFGPAAQPLFGCYHEPDLARRRQCAVIICQPIGHEYINCHRALRQLAVRLAEVGFPVLRFDYYGCGDSSGNAEAGTISRWLEDISEAIFQVKQRSKLDTVCIAGLRLGGALAAMLGAERGDIESMLLWDPVVDGKSYLEDLQLVQKEQMRSRPKPGRRERAQEHLEILGFPFTHALYSQVQEIKLRAITRRPAKNMFMIQSRTSDQGRGAELFNLTESNWEYQALPIPQIWLPTTNGSLLVPGQALQSIVSWTCRMHS